MRHADLWLEKVESARFGLKGPQAAEALAQAGFSVPSKPNTWAPLRAAERDDSPDVIARLGNTEFFIEEQGDAPGITSLRARLAGAPGAYPVLREDVGLVLGGARAAEALAEVCNVDFAALLADKPAVMTQMIGLSIIAIAVPHIRTPTYRIWCDPSFGSYLWETLEEVVSSTIGRAA